MKTKEDFRQHGYGLRANGSPLPFTHAKSWQQKAMAEGYADASVDLADHGGRKVSHVAITGTDGSVANCGEVTYQNGAVATPATILAGDGFPQAVSAHIASLFASALSRGCSVERKHRLLRKIDLLRSRHGAPSPTPAP